MVMRQNSNYSYSPTTVLKEGFDLTDIHHAYDVYSYDDVYMPNDNNSKYSYYDESTSSYLSHRYKHDRANNDKSASSNSYNYNYSYQNATSSGYTNATPNTSNSRGDTDVYFDYNPITPESNYNSYSNCNSNCNSNYSYNVYNRPLLTPSPPTPFHKFQPAHQQYATCPELLPRTRTNTQYSPRMRLSSVPTKSYSTMTTPTPPTPIPRFEHFDLTHFLDDAETTTLASQSYGTLPPPPPPSHSFSSERTPRSTPTHESQTRLSDGASQKDTQLLFSLASPSYDYHSVVHSSYCHYNTYPNEQNGTTTPNTYATYPPRTAAGTTSSVSWKDRSPYPLSPLNVQRSRRQHQQQQEKSLSSSQNTTIQNLTYLSNKKKKDRGDNNKAAVSQQTMNIHNGPKMNNASNSSGACGYYYNYDNNNSNNNDNEVDMFATDCIQLPSFTECHDRLFDRLCRSNKKPQAVGADDDVDDVASNTTSSGGSVTKTTQQRDEIRSCGTLPPENDDDMEENNSLLKKTSIKQNRSNHHKTALQKNVAAKARQKTVDHRISRYKHYNKQSNDNPIFGSTANGREKSRSNSPNDHDYENDHDDDYTSYPGSSSRISMMTRDTTTSSSCCAGGDGSDNLKTRVLERRAWLIRVVQDLFSDGDNTSKVILYASNIAKDPTIRCRPRRDSNNKHNQNNSNKKTNSTNTVLMNDYAEIKEFCDFVLHHVDVDQVLDNIEQGLYDNHLEDFQEDLEICLEDAMDQYEVVLEHENTKWKNNKKNGSNSDSAGTSTTSNTKNEKKCRREELRMFAGGQLLRQFETDFKMHVLDQVVFEIGQDQPKQCSQ